MIKNLKDSSRLQGNVDMLVQWANRREINSIEKCKELHFGMKNEKTQYQLNSKWSTGTKLWGLTYMVY